MEMTQVSLILALYTVQEATTHKQRSNINKHLVFEHDQISNSAVHV